MASAHAADRQSGGEGAFQGQGERGTPGLPVPLRASANTTPQPPCSPDASEGTELQGEAGRGQEAGICRARGAQRVGTCFASGALASTAACAPAHHPSHPHVAASAQVVAWLHALPASLPAPPCSPACPPKASAQVQLNACIQTRGASPQCPGAASEVRRTPARSCPASPAPPGSPRPGGRRWFRCAPGTPAQTAGGRCGRGEGGGGGGGGGLGERQNAGEAGRGVRGVPLAAQSWLAGWSCRSDKPHQSLPAVLQAHAASQASHGSASKAVLAAAASSRRAKPAPH